MTSTTCFQVFERCVQAVEQGELITEVSAQDKEFHFQNWFEARLNELPFNHEGSGRNAYPDFSIVQHTEGYDTKGLAFPGRCANYDANSQVPSGFHNGRQIFYVFGRYPKDLSDYYVAEAGRNEYPVIDLVICHGDFLNANHEYVHENKNVKGFGTYGDLMIRDRKMYVAPTPFALAEGVTGLMTLIVPDTFDAPPDVQEVGRLVRIEAAELVVGYTFDLRTNELTAERVPNPSAGAEHHFVAYRMAGRANKPVTMSALTIAEEG